MRKQELVNLHGVLFEVTQSLVDQGTISPEIWVEYESLDIHPNSIHAQKSDHRDAVLLLVIAVGTALDEPTEAESPVAIR